MQQSPVLTSPSRRVLNWYDSVGRSRVSATAFAGLCALVSSAALATAQTTRTYTGASTTPNDFGTAGNYSGGVLPSTTNGDTALFDGTYAGNLSLIYSNGAFNGVSPEPGIFLSLAATQTGSVSIDAGTNTNQIRLGGITIASGAGALTLGDGNNVFNLRLGGGGGTTSTFTNNSTNTATLNADVAIALGANADHTLAVGGTGDWQFNNALVNNANGTTGVLSLAKNGTGTMTLTNFSSFTGGTTVNGGKLVLGAGGTGSGTVRGAVTVNSGAALSLTAADALGYNSGSQVTVLNINGGTVDNATNANEGFLTSFNLTGGTLSSTGGGNFNIYPNGTGSPGITTNASGTVSTISGGISIRGGALGVAVATGTTANGVDLLISGVINDNGAAGNGALTKTGSGYLNLTGQNTFTGPVNVSAGTLNIGAAGGATTSALGVDNTTKAITVSSGATLSGTINNWFGNGNQVNSGGVSTLPTITLNGGALTTSRYTAIGALNLNGATVTTNVTADAGNYQTFALRGDVTVGGTSASTIASTNVDATHGGYHLGANTTFTVAATGSAGPDLTVSAPLINQSGDFGNAAGGLTKAGAGVMALTATNTYTGATTVNAGTLLVSGRTAAGSAVTVNNSGTIGGTGTVAGTVTVGNGGTISAGNSVQSTTGTFTTGALTLQSGSTFNALLASNSSFSTLNASGTTALGGAAFTINVTPGATFTNGTVLELITSGVSGMFTNSTYTAGGYNFTADYTTNSGFFSVDIAPVPEPATWFGGLLLVGAAAASQRRKVTGWLRLGRA